MTGSLRGTMKLRIRDWILLTFVFGATGLFVTIPKAAILIIGIVLPIHFICSSPSQWPLKIRFRKYISSFVIYFYGMYQSWQYDRDSRNVFAIQGRTLRRLLTENADTAYVNEHKLQACTSISAFRQLQPLTNYKDVQPYVEAMMAGKNNQLTRRKPTYFGKTSGTTGSPSIIPLTKFTGIQQWGNVALFMYNADKVLDWSKLHWMRPIWKVSYTPPRIIEQTESGILCGPITANPLWTKLQGEIYTSPSICFQIEDASAGGYLQLVFALRYRRLGAIEGFFASLVYFAFKQMESEWQSLVNDIRYGMLKPDPKVPAHIRQELLKYLRPDPQRADELEKESAKGFEGIASRIWPELGIINCITTGTFAIYSRHLSDHYAKGTLIYSTGLLSTEGILGVNFWPFTPIPQYSVLPRTQFYEFIPLEDVNKSNPATVLANEVRVGEDYELVITTGSGLYRYRMGDIVRVANFYNEIPLFEFVSRVNAMLNAKNEKVTEELIYSVLTNVEDDIKSTGEIRHITDYCSCESIMLKTANGKKGSFHIYFLEIELTSSDVDMRWLAETLAEQIDRKIGERHFRYKELREIGSLSSPVVYIVKPGAFQRLREDIQRSSRASYAQIKIPRVLTSSQPVDFLLSERS